MGATISACLALPCDTTHLPSACETGFRWSSHFVVSSFKSINPSHWCALPFRAQIKWGKSFHKKKNNTESRAFFLAWFAVKSGKFVELMLESYQKDSFSESSDLMRAGRAMTIPVPENSWHFDICFHSLLNPKPNLDNIFAKWSYIKMSILTLQNVRFSVRVSFLSKMTGAPWSSDFPCPKLHWFFFFCKMFHIQPGNISWKKIQLISNALSSSMSKNRKEDHFLYSPLRLLEEGNFSLNLIPCGQSCPGLPRHPCSNCLHVWYWICPHCQEFASVWKRNKICKHLEQKSNWSKRRLEDGRKDL